MSGRHEVAEARDRVIKASLKLAAAEWDNGRTTAYDSMDLDHAQDQMDEALAEYVRAATGTNDVSAPSTRTDSTT